MVFSISLANGAIGKYYHGTKFSSDRPGFLFFGNVEPAARNIFVCIQARIQYRVALAINHVLDLNFRTGSPPGSEYVGQGASNSVVDKNCTAIYAHPGQARTGFC